MSNETKAEEISYKDMWERLKAILRSDLNLSLKELRYDCDSVETWEMMMNAECARRSDTMLELMRDIEDGKDGVNLSSVLVLNREEEIKK